MEQKLNIAKILKNKPKGTKLYSMIHGECSFEAVTDEIFKINFCTSKFGLTQSGECTLIKFGNMYDGGECVIFPSKEMRDWSKFAWKKGDVLVNKDGDVYIIFERFADDTYCSFVGKYYLWKENNDTEQFYEKERLLTSDFQKAGKDDAQTYINTIEKRLGGNFNRETLEIEKAQPEFKDGDIVVAEEDNYYDRVIFIAAIKDDIVSKALINVRYEDYEVNYNEYRFGRNRNLRLATDSEKKQLFSALTKEGKAWDAEKKEFVDLKPKWTPKPFDRVITRNDDDDIWTANIFSHMDSHGEYVTIGCVGGYTYCIPYNEETAKLIGTTNNVEG